MKRSELKTLIKEMLVEESRGPKYDLEGAKANKQWDNVLGFDASTWNAWLMPLTDRYNSRAFYLAHEDTYISLEKLAEKLDGDEHGWITDTFYVLMEKDPKKVLQAAVELGFADEYHLNDIVEEGIEDVDPTLVEGDKVACDNCGQWNKVTIEESMEDFSPSQIDRAAGLVNIKAMETIVADLVEDGFDPEVVPEIIEAILEREYIQKYL
jgi:hypothetical protein